MFKRLRNRFLILNMTIISVVMIAAFAVIYATTYSSAMADGKRRLDQSGVRFGGSFQPVGESRYSVWPDDSVGYAESSSKTSQVLADPDYYIVDTFNDNDSVSEANSFYSAAGRTDNVDLIITDTVNLSTIITIGQLTVSDSVAFSVVMEDGEVQSINTFLDMPDEAYQTAANLAWEEKKNYSVITVENRDWMYVFQSSSVRLSVAQEDDSTVSITAYDNVIRSEILFLDITDVTQALYSQLYVTVAVAAAMLVVIFIISLVFANRAIRPISVTWDKQRQFIADASHELKTPLTIVGANMDALETCGDETVASQRMWLDFMRQELARMGKLVGDLLYLARVEEAPEDNLPIDLSAAADNAAAAMEAVAYEHGLELSLDIEQSIFVKGDGGKLIQAILILLDNAVKYSTQGGVVRLILTRVKNTALLRVINNGYDIPAEKISRIFDRFYRVDSSRAQETGGYGLGLPIAKAIVERCGGVLTVESKNGETAFIISIKCC